MDSQAEGSVSDGRSRARRLLSRLVITVLVLAIPVGGIVWLFQDELFHPFGDARACDGSDAQLSDVIGAGMAPIPADASDIHYFTRDGRAQVSFVSGRIPEFLDRAGFATDQKPLFDKQDGGAYALADGESELPEGLCGPGIRGPVWSYSGTAVSVLVERSDINPDSFRTPAARAIVTYTSP
ncbi:hypothetical protein [Streptomyces sp. NPDC057287]|uniref:hypothetical protein n=1 Tax=Streptomyces sp. NPDC057287 TaxID=3346086 RepID=UPI0036294E27